MTDTLDHETMEAVADLAEEGLGNYARLMHRLWKDRETLLDALRTIHDWDLMSSEVRTLTRVDSLAEEALAKVGEEPPTEVLGSTA